MKTYFIAICLVVTSMVHASGIFISWKDRNRIQAVMEIPDPFQSNCIIKTTVIKQISGVCMYRSGNTIVSTCNTGDFFSRAEQYTRKGIFMGNIEADQQTVSTLLSKIDTYHRQHSRSDDCTIL